MQGLIAIVSKIPRYREGDQWRTWSKERKGTGIDRATRRVGCNMRVYEYSHNVCVTHSFNCLSWHLFILFR